MMKLHFLTFKSTLTAMEQSLPDDTLRECARAVAKASGAEDVEWVDAPVQGRLHADPRVLLQFAFHLPRRLQAELRRAAP